FLDGMRRFYFTYRKGFATITPSFYTSDMGWGCTYRTCQMMLAESFSRVLLGRFWDPFRLTSAQQARHARIVEWFHDSADSSAYYSIHNMSRVATYMDKRIGDWLGPSIGAHVMLRISRMHHKCPLAIHVALDQEVFTKEVRETAFGGPARGPNGWKPLLLLVPVRLGFERVDPKYTEKIKTLFQIPQTVGLVGGKPSRSYYFIGRQGDNLFFLDPHVTRNFSDSSDFESLGIADTDEYHTTHICTIGINKLDPSMLIGFLFNTEAEWESFAQAATDKDSSRAICTGATPLFTL
ncbi:peptidase C54, partial [Linderina pennispora]